MRENVRRVLDGAIQVAPRRKACDEQLGLAPKSHLQIIRYLQLMRMFLGRKPDLAFLATKSRPLARRSVRTTVVLGVLTS